MKRINIHQLQPGDIVLTASRTSFGKGIRLTTKGAVSHAMICVQHGSIIDSTLAGVHARNPQRIFFKDHEKIHAFRLREELTELQLAQVIDFARGQVGVRYSISEAARSVVGVRKPRNSKLFCSRLVARAYASVGVNLVRDEDYCTPEQLRISPLLRELGDVTETVSDNEVAELLQLSDPVQMFEDAQNTILNVARRFDTAVEHFTDMHMLILKHPEWDSAIAQAYRESGYLDLWRHDLEENPWHYDLEHMESNCNQESSGEIRDYCINTIREAYSGSTRFAHNLAQYKSMHETGQRLTFSLLIDLYETLIQVDQLRRDTALGWLRRHFPNDVALFMEWVIPHSDLWFFIVDRVEPKLGAIARISIANGEKLDVCSSCGDYPTRDYRIANAAEVMPGVPSLRLCDDCVEIRRGYGELLKPFEPLPND